MPKTEIGYKHLIRFETITPVAVGDGGVLSPLSDYSINPANKSQALLLNQKRFETWLSENSAALTDYLNEVKDNIGKNRNTFLHLFISKYHAKNAVISFFSDARTVVGYNNTVELKTCIKDAGRSYIPGSTLKGAFKSVWLHDWLMRYPEKVEEILLIIEQSGNEKDGRVKIEELLVACLDDNPHTTRRLEFSALQIGDAYCMGTFNWYHTARFFLSKDKKNKVPLFIEAIAPLSKGEFSLMVEDNQCTYTRHPGIEALKNDSLKPFFKQINRYAIDQIEHELEMTKSEELWDYQQFLRNLKAEIDQSDNHSGWLPIGFGKSNFYQSIGLFIRQRNKQTFEKYIKLFKMGKKPDKQNNETDQKELPLTRNLTLEGHYPLGWIRLYTTEEISEPVAFSTFEKGMQIEATVVSIARPLSKIKIPGVDELINMSGTKEAQKNVRFKEQSVLVVEIDVNKEAKISQARFVRVK